MNEKGKKRFKWELEKFVVTRLRPFLEPPYIHDMKWTWRRWRGASGQRSWDWMTGRGLAWHKKWRYPAHLYRAAVHGEAGLRVRIQPQPE